MPFHVIDTALKFTLIILLVIGIDAGIDAQSSTSDSVTSPAKIPSAKKPNDLIHRGDLIEVDIVGSIEFDWRGEVTPEGFLIGIGFSENDSAIDAVCESEEYVAKKIEAVFSDFLKDPKVIVTILDRSNRSVSIVLGGVVKPQRYRMKRDIRLNEILILSGGITGNASGEIQIIHKKGASCAADLSDEKGEVNKNLPPNFSIVKISDLLKGKAAANPNVFYGDLITVLKAQPVYVIGAVESPTKLAFRTGLTVARAISSSGGLTKGANPKEVTIFRRKTNKIEVLKFDLTGILPPGGYKLEPFDIVEVSGKLTKKNVYPPIIPFEDDTAEDLELPIRIID